jgi:hypothetical protein
MREELTGSCRKLRSEELHDLYFSPNLMRWVGHVACMGNMRNPYRILV